MIHDVFLSWKLFLVPLLWNSASLSAASADRKKVICKWFNLIYENHWNHFHSPEKVREVEYSGNVHLFDTESFILAAAVISQTLCMCSSVHRALLCFWLSGEQRSGDIAPTQSLAPEPCQERKMAALKSKNLFTQLHGPEPRYQITME